ncbi:hypothetical protein [Argonema antarcticum]|uniref:hypothetical protein n=1 Tax=Argonema antarcticum TaxID=2942763 RepID=UPI002012F963|nr:hypothetical protein [Argonema antarcticum]MCL1472740.1 hypothetical protein [Argonema antarcticum A004/B2]
MSLNPEQLKQHCDNIILSRRIKNKIVVLCEGERGIKDTKDRLSPQSYARMEQMPDANFYKACVPRWWSQYKPEFFNCGDRKDVIDTYFNLLEIHTQDNNNSYLIPEKLFAIVDLDLQLQKIDNYTFSDTEAIFCDLYGQCKVNEINANNHRIWVTGLVHKEAYFLIPDLQEVFDNIFASPLYNSNSLVLENIYLTMADAIVDDVDLKNNLPTIANRINYLSSLDCSDTDKLRDSWKAEFDNTQNDIEKNELILALLTIKKAKDYWNKIHPPTDYSSPAERFREQLLLEIGQFYSHNSSDSRYHISFFLATLYKFV